MEKEIESAILNTMKGEKPGTSRSPFSKGKTWLTDGASLVHARSDSGNPRTSEKPGTSHPFTGFLHQTHLENNIFLPRPIEIERGR
jgi:hypothetical protein